MAISRGLQPRQLYGLGSLVKSIKKGVKTGIKGIANTVKENPLLSLAALNFAPMLPMFGGGAPFIGMGSLTGRVGTIPGITSLISGGAKKTGEKSLGGTLAAFAGGSLLGGLLNDAEEEGDPEGITRDVGALRAKLTNAYKNQRTFANSENEDAAIADQVEVDLSEYNQDMNRTNVAYGGRMQYGLGNLVSASMKAGDSPVTKNSGMGGMIAKLLNNNPNILEKLKTSNSNNSNYFIDENFNGIDDRQEAAYGGRMSYGDGTDFDNYLKSKKKFQQQQNLENEYREYLEDKRKQKVAEQKTMAANGGRIGFARGPDNPEQNAMQAAGIMNLPLNQNPAGVTELDLRETGGFIPPVGVKEKADDIPAMLANNEFVFTADAVRGMGDGNVNKGAQRMYDMMKKLEKGGRV